MIQPDSTGGLLARTTITVRVRLDSADLPLGDSLGWQTGVPEAEVRLLRNGTASWMVERSDSVGEVRFEGLSPGIYRVYAGRTLTELEASRVGAVVRAFGDGRSVRVSGDTLLELLLYADRPGSLLISEIGNGMPVPWETGGTSYPAGLFFELYNNSDSTVYLDGKVFGVAWSFWVEASHTPCAASEPARADPEGVHTWYLLQFPGAGGEYPVGPGEVRTVAMAAIDHRPVHPTLLDLSDADFEIGWGGSGNNPAVPDMVDIGLRPWVHQNLLATMEVYFLAEAFDPASLPVLFRDPSTGDPLVRVPRDLLLDVAALVALWPLRDPDFPPCGLAVHRDFDRYEGGFFEVGFDIEYAYNSVRGLQRRVLRVGRDGRRILYNTNTSAVDFVHDLKTPGGLPEP